MRHNIKQSIYYSASSIYMFRVSTTSIIRSTPNCNYSLRYWSCCANYSLRYWSCCAVQLPPSNVAKLAWPRWREVDTTNYVFKEAKCFGLIMNY